MSSSLQKTVFFSFLIVNQAFCREPLAITAIINDIAITAKAMTSGDCLDLFYKDLRGDRIFPVVMSINNRSNDTLRLNAENIKIANASLLTPKRLESQISSMQMGTTLFIFVFFPMAFFTNYLVSKLQALMPIIKKFSIHDTSIVIKPGEKIEKILFIELDVPKDVDGKTRFFIVPNYLNIELCLKNNSFFPLKKSTVFYLHLPID